MMGFVDLRPPSKPGMGDPASLNIVFVSRQFQPGSDTFDARFRFVGPSPAAREDEEGWSPPDEPVLYVALSTAFNDRPDFYRSRLEAFDDAGPVAVAVGRQVDVHDLGQCPTTSTSGRGSRSPRCCATPARSSRTRAWARR